MLPFALGIINIPFLVSQPAFGLFDLLRFLLYLIGEHRDIGIIETFLDLINPGVDLVDGFCCFVKVCFETGEFCSTVPCLFLLPCNRLLRWSAFRP